jgi:hypothetical protein
MKVTENDVRRTNEPRFLAQLSQMTLRNIEE